MGIEYRSRHDNQEQMIANLDISVSTSGEITVLWKSVVQQTYPLTQEPIPFSLSAFSSCVDSVADFKRTSTFGECPCVVDL